MGDGRDRGSRAAGVGQPHARLWVLIDLLVAWTGWEAGNRDEASCETKCHCQPPTNDRRVWLHVSEIVMVVSTVRFPLAYMQRIKARNRCGDVEYWFTSMYSIVAIKMVSQPHGDCPAA